MEIIKEQFHLLCLNKCSGKNSIDIMEHLPVLYNYAKECDSVFETGVRGCVSSWAFLYGLLDNPTQQSDRKKKLFMNDLTVCDVSLLMFLSKNYNIDVRYEWKNNLLLDVPNINDTFDITFIDTWHIYGQLKRELNKFAKFTNKYIIMHDTTVDAIFGETIRLGWDAKTQSIGSGIPVDEINKGLWPAVTEFLENNAEWYLKERLTNNNGLTILARKNVKTVYPITFSIPAEKITNAIHKKTKIVSSLIPGKRETYIYNNETEYYNEYKQSMFAITTKKAGWDCLRHYEIIANGCIPYFENIQDCPTNTLCLFPKDLILEGNSLYEKIIANSLDENKHLQEYNHLLKRLMDYLKTHLTTEHLAKYVLKKSNHENASKILYLSGDATPDYLRCLTLHGFKKLLGNCCHDYPKIPHIYKNEPINYESLYGKGITYTNLLEPEYRNDEYDKNVETRIANKQYDVIIYGSYHRGLPFFDLIMQHYSPSDVILMCGEDVHNCDYTKFAKHGFHTFVREM